MSACIAEWLFLALTALLGKFFSGDRRGETYPASRFAPRIIRLVTGKNALGPPF